MKALEKMAELQQEKNTLDQKIRDMATAVFDEEAKVLFDKHPNLVSISWAQYTPYFNDGDTCEFSAGTDDCNITYLVDGEEDTEEYASMYTARTRVAGEPNYRGVIEPATEKDFALIDFSEFIANFGDDLLLFMFGDHVRVTMARDGTTTDEYDHD